MDTLTHPDGSNRSSWLMWSVLIAASSTFLPTAALAYEPKTELGSVAGFTELQQRTGDTVQTVCIALGGGDNVDLNRDDVAQQRELADKCGEMVGTAVSFSNGGDGNSLDITEQQLGAALQNVTAEEVAAAGSLTTESSAGQSNIVGRRLAGVLTRASTLQVSSANMQRSNSIVLTELPHANGFSSGGGAAAESGALSNPLGFYVNGLLSFTDKTGTAKEDGFESDSSGISIGVDYLYGNSLLGGLNVAYSSSATDFDVSEDVSGGDMDSNQFNLAVYGMWFSDAGYLDVVAGYGAGTYDFERRVVIESGANASDGFDGANDTVTADTDSTAFQFSVGAGKDLNSGALTFTPYGRLSYLTVDLDGYEEQGSSALKMRVNSQSIDSFTGEFGFRLVRTYSGTRAIISPQFNIEIIHEFMDDSREIVSTYVHDPNNLPLKVITDRPDRTYYTISAGLSAVLQNGVQLFGEVRSLLGMDNLSEFSATGGVRLAF